MRTILTSILFSFVLTTTSSAQLVDTPLGPVVENFTMQAIGTYKGTTPLPNVKLGDSGNAVSQAEVVVHSPDKPVILVLTAYDPTVWRVGRTQDSEIAGVLVSGYHAQAIVGIEKSVPLRIATHDSVDGPVGYFFAYQAEQRLLDMNDKLVDLFGRGIDRFSGKNQIIHGTFYAGPKLPTLPPRRPAANEKIIYSDDYKIADYDVRKINNDGEPNKNVEPNPVTGQAALEALLDSKKLRLATSADIKAWEAKASEPYKKFNPDLRIKSRMRPSRTYVVLDKLDLPDGLHGSRSRSFIIPAETPLPGGPEGHNSLYLMTDGSEKGPGSRRDR